MCRKRTVLNPYLLRARNARNTATENGDFEESSEPSLSRGPIRRRSRSSGRRTCRRRSRPTALGAVTYGSGFKPKTLLVELEKVRYSELDLSHLYRDQD